MSKRLLVFTDVKQGGSGPFQAVYGPVAIEGDGLVVGSTITATFNKWDVDYFVDGLEGTWLEPKQGNPDILVIA